MRAERAVDPVSAATSHSLNTSRNLQKHTNLNPIQRRLLRSFHRKVALLLTDALARLPSQGRNTEGLPMVLDAGCGEGFVTAYLTQQLPKVPFLGADARRDAVTFARLQNASADSWVVGDLTQLPLRDNSVPYVLCLEVLEHLTDPWAALEELRRVCSGSLILSVPCQPLFALANLLRGKNLRTLGDDPEHISHWTSRTFLRLLRQRVKITRVAYAFPWVIAVADLQKHARE